MTAPSQTEMAFGNMSDAKWRKLFRAIEPLRPYIREAHWKFVGQGDIWKARFPPPDIIGETGFSDSCWNGPFPFKDIEPICIPRSCPHPQSDPKRPLPALTQPLEEVLEALEAVAHFPVVLTGDGLVIAAYR